ncbi:hypothetical protein IAU60_003261 [Kwoniella sp. DSM 27419]
MFRQALPHGLPEPGNHPRLRYIDAHQQIGRAHSNPSPIRRRDVIQLEVAGHRTWGKHDNRASRTNGKDEEPATRDEPEASVPEDTDQPAELALPSLDPSSSWVALKASPAPDATHRSLAQWAESVAGAPKPDPFIDETAKVSDDDISRPGSPPHAICPIHQVYSNDEADRTPALTPHHTGSIDEAEEIPDQITSLEGRAKEVRPPPILDVRSHDESLPPPSPGDTDRTGLATHSDARQPRHYVRSRKEHWWKRDPHPMYSPQYASRRLFIQFPIPVRIDQVKLALTNHSSRFGSVRAVFHYQVQNEYCEKAFVVFDDIVSVQKVFADPTASTCSFHSTARAGRTELDLMIQPSQAVNLTRTLYIRLTGRRADSKALSTSPAQSCHADSHRVSGRDRLDPFHTAVLPPKLSIDAVPQRSSDGRRVCYWARIRPWDESFSFEEQSKLIRADTGKSLRTIDEVDLSQRVSDKDLVPKLCHYFAEVCDIVPPRKRGLGWMVTVSGKQEGHHLMRELGKVPGIFIRWADEPYSPHMIDTVAPATPTLAGPQTTLDPQAPRNMSFPQPQMNGEGEVAIGEANRPSSIGETGCSCQGGDTDEPLVGDSTKESAFREQIIAPLNVVHPLPINPGQFVGGPSHSSNFDGLQRKVCHMYRGRVVKEDLSGITPQYVDEAAIHVRGLVKEKETYGTLLRRFGRHGKINTIEYFPLTDEKAYGTARIMFQDKTSAQGALTESGRASFGSVLQVEPRRVLLNAVYIKEMYFDHSGRAISPSIMSQRSVSSATRVPPPLPPGPPPTTAASVNASPTACGSWQYFPPYQLNMWCPPPLPPPTMHAMPPLSVSQHLHGPPGPINLPYPMLCAAFGIGYLPPPHPGQYMPQQPIPPSPPVTPPVDNVAPSHRPPADDTTGSMRSEPVVIVPEGFKGNGKSKLNPIGFKQEGGVFRAVYDPEQLAAYCKENGLSPPVSHIAQSDESAHRGEAVQLLPIFTGGHDTSFSAPRASCDGQKGAGRHNHSSATQCEPNPSPSAASVNGVRTVPIPIPFSPATFNPVGDPPCFAGAQSPSADARTHHTQNVTHMTDLMDSNRGAVKTSMANDLHLQGSEWGDSKDNSEKGRGRWANMRGRGLQPR